MFSLTDSIAPLATKRFPGVSTNASATHKAARRCRDQMLDPYGKMKHPKADPPQLTSAD